MKIILFVFLSLAQSVFASDLTNATSLHYDFSKATREESLGWTTVVRDLPKEILDEVERRVDANETLGPVGPEVDRNQLLSYPEEISHWLINFGVYPLPHEIQHLGNGFLCQGSNRSDDLDMWIVKKIGSSEGLKPNTEYKVKMDVKFASNAQAGGLGAGGSEAALAVQLGITSKDPREKKILPNGEGGVRFADGILSNEFDTGATIANDLPYSQTDKPYRIVAVNNSNTLTARTDENAELWLMVGTHSGFESFQAIYYTEVNVSLSVKRPKSRQPQFNGK